VTYITQNCKQTLLVTYSSQNCKQTQTISSLVIRKFEFCDYKKKLLLDLLSTVAIIDSSGLKFQFVCDQASSLTVWAK